MMNLKPKDGCPLHNGRRDCCGRSEFVRYAQVKKQGHGIWKPTGATGILRSDDGREKCSKAVLRWRKDSLLRQGIVCEACHEPFTDYRDVELSHRVGKGLGGSTHNDAYTNLTLLHARANREQGSLDLETYLAKKWKPEHCL